jgi:hypothetical protein
MIWLKFRNLLWNWLQWTNWFIMPVVWTLVCSPECQRTYLAAGMKYYPLYIHLCYLKSTYRLRLDLTFDSETKAFHHTELHKCMQDVCYYMHHRETNSPQICRRSPPLTMPVGLNKCSCGIVVIMENKSKFRKSPVQTYSPTPCVSVGSQRSSARRRREV